MFQRKFSNGGHFSKHSFSDGDSRLGLADASHDALNSALSAPSLKTSLCRR